jgi:hypothetical protein
LEEALPPQGYQWLEEAWVTDKTYTQVDSEGWCYGISFEYIMSNLKNKSSTTQHSGRVVRRKRLTRLAIPSANGSEDDTDRRTTLSSKSDSESRASTVASGSLRANKQNFSSKVELYNSNPFRILAVCFERETLDSDIIIPWDQVSKTCLITPSVLSVTVNINRFFASNESSLGQMV